MKHTSIFIFLLFLSTEIKAQSSPDAVFEAIEQNNTALRALRAEIEAEKLGNRVGLALPDLEIEVGYQRGTPSEIGPKRDLSVRQGFDIATLSGNKKRVGECQNALLEHRYQAERMALRTEARLCVTDIVYQNALLRMLERRRKHAEILVETQRKKREAGESSLPDYNSVRLKLSTLEGEIAAAETERIALLDRLSSLNGGMPLTLSDTVFESVSLPSDFETWYAGVEQSHPVLAYAGDELRLSQRRVSLTRSERLPSFSVGYVSEKTSGEGFRGIAVGVSLPLWSNRRRMNQAKAAVVAAEARRDDTNRQFRHRWEMLFRRALGLQHTAEKFRHALQTTDNTDGLKKALAAGEISLPAYLIELEFYYDAADKALAAERDYRKAMAELSAATL